MSIIDQSESGLTDEEGYDFLETVKANFNILDYHLYSSDGSRIAIAVNKNHHDLVLLVNSIPSGFLNLHNSDIPWYKDKFYEPMPFILPELRGLGYAKLMYEWVLENGFSLITEAQTVYAARLWKSLSKRYNLVVVSETDVFHGENALNNIETDDCFNIMLSKKYSLDSFLADLSSAED